MIIYAVIERPVGGTTVEHYRGDDPEQAASHAGPNRRLRVVIGGYYFHSAEQLAPVLAAIELHQVGWAPVSAGMPNTATTNHTEDTA